MSPATLVEKIWREHEVSRLDADTSLLLIDRIFLHERVGGRMLSGLQAAGRPVHDPRTVFGTMDHIIDTHADRNDDTKFAGGKEFIQLFRGLSKSHDIPIFDMGDDRQGITHVIAPDLGIALPGQTYICGDSHTCTIGGLGALAWGIGVTQGEHALATQTLPVSRPRQMRLWCDGALADGVSAKDLILSIIGRFGAGGGDGHALEFAGPAIRALSVEARLTLCNMAVEFGAWTGIVAPDDLTFEYLAGRTFAPKEALWDRALTHWRSLPSDDHALFDAELRIDAARLSPQVTWGTSPAHVVDADGRVPDPAAERDSAVRRAMEKALAYTGLTPGEEMSQVPIEAAFIGSCTNARLDDLREAARILKGRHVAPGLKALCVPGSTEVKRRAEAEGLDRIFLAAGFEWREAGCSLCFFANGETFGDARRVITSTNRNFENRQGPGVRSHLAAPATVAASAITGRITSAARLVP